MNFFLLGTTATARALALLARSKHKHRPLARFPESYPRGGREHFQFPLPAAVIAIVLNPTENAQFAPGYWQMGHSRAATYTRQGGPVHKHIPADTPHFHQFGF